MRLLALLLFVGCVSESPVPPDGSLVIDDPMEPAHPVDPITRLPACARLATSDTCCHLACSDYQAFVSQCGTPGACAEFICPLQGGGNITTEVCKP